jgi:trichothecene 3-O-acetyltransferase
MLDVEVICPVRGMGYEYDDTDELPVFIVQANFISGGLLLCFASMHNALDMNGQGLALKMFAAAGRGEALDPSLVEAGNRDADSIVPLLGAGETSLPHESMRRSSTLGMSPVASGRPRPAIWVYWRLSRDKLLDLKQAASSGDGWVSTNDAISAFLVQRLTSVRVAANRLSGSEPVVLQRAVDGRSILKPPVVGYMGHLVAVAETEWESADELSSSSLADVTQDLRRSLRLVDDHFIRSLATLINSTEDKTTIFYGAKNKPGRDFLVSSWAQLHWMFNTDFGPGLGAVDFVRRARLPEVPDLTYLMPKDARGNMHLATCMFHEDFVDLANDTAWRKYTERVG